MTTVPLAVRPAATAGPGDHRWVAHTSCPPDWLTLVERCGGGFFHSPLGLLAGAPAGQPVFFELVHGARVVGIAAGVRHGCRFSLRPRHVYFPSLPAIPDAPGRGEALAELVAALRREGAVEVVIDSFDAEWQADAEDATPGRSRCEFPVTLAGSPAEQITRFHPHHVRRLKHAADANWTLGMLGGDAARAMLATVQASATERARDRGRGFVTEPPALANIAVTRLSDPWGATVFTAWDGATPLGAALVAWANRRAYYVSGGSTPHGYASSAGFWLHWRIMGALAAAGLETYNLGGTPAEAADPGHPEHGLYQFKWRFGASVKPCLGARWSLQAAHARTHQIVAEIMSAARSAAP